MEDRKPTVFRVAWNTDGIVDYRDFAAEWEANVHGNDMICRGAVDAKAWVIDYADSDFVKPHAVPDQDWSGYKCQRELDDAAFVTELLNEINTHSLA